MRNVVAVTALVALLALFSKQHARGEEMRFERSIPTEGSVMVKTAGPRHGYNCPDFPDGRCPEVVNVGAQGLWPPDDGPRANWAFLALIFSACRVGAYDVPPSPLGRGPVHWLWARCEW